MDSQKVCDNCYGWFQTCVRNRTEMNLGKDEINGIEKDCDHEEKCK